MKFKYTIIGLLTAILLTCILTSYSLISETKKQTELQIAQTEAIFGTYDYVHDIATGQNKKYMDSESWDGSGSGWMIYAEPTFREAAKFGKQYE